MIDDNCIRAPGRQPQNKVGRDMRGVGPEGVGIIESGRVWSCRLRSGAGHLRYP